MRSLNLTDLIHSSPRAIYVMQATKVPLSGISGELGNIANAVKGSESLTLNNGKSLATKDLQQVLGGIAKFVEASPDAEAGKKLLSALCLKCRDGRKPRLAILMGPEQRTALKDSGLADESGYFLTDGARDVLDALHTVKNEKTNDFDFNNLIRTVHKDKFR